MNSVSDLIKVYGDEFEVLDLGYKQYVFPINMGYVGKSPRKPKMFRLEDGKVSTNVYSDTKEGILRIYKTSHPEAKFRRKKFVK